MVANFISPERVETFEKEFCSVKISWADLGDNGISELILSKTVSMAGAFPNGFFAAFYSIETLYFT